MTTCASLLSAGSTAGRAQQEEGKKPHVYTASCLAATLFSLPPCSASGWLLPRSRLTPSHPPNYTHPYIHCSTPGSLCQNAFPHRSPCLPSHFPHTCTSEVSSVYFKLLQPSAICLVWRTECGNMETDVWSWSRHELRTLGHQGILPIVDGENSLLASS